VAQAEYTAKRDPHDAQRRAGQPPRGKEPQPPSTGPKDSDQVHLTDAESRILPAGSDFVQGYNAQAVAAESMLILAMGVCRRATTSGRWRRCWNHSRRYRSRSA